jgi:hypothetical protein
MRARAASLGAFKSSEIERGVQSSRCTVVVLSPAFATDRLAELAEPVRCPEGARAFTAETIW